ncbi:MAG TPA: DNA methyltransferase, partial [Candidatus Hodarchaeales archaeon]|nr:DNA methyltransferase [Candidatus Hodarchaeales archaeon]
MLNAELSTPYRYEFSESKWKQAKGSNSLYGRLTGHSLHYMAPYAGSFPPELVHYFLMKYSDPNDIVLDPFSGRGTTGLQSVLKNRRVIVNDMNPLAYVYTHAKLFPYSSREVERFLRNIPLESSDSSDLIDPNDREILTAYFHDETLREIAAIRRYLREDKSKLSLYVSGLLAGASQGNRISNLSVTMSALICFSSNYMRKWSEKTGTFPEYREVIPRLVAKAERLEKDGLNFRR